MTASAPKFEHKLSFDPDALLADVCLPLLLRAQNQDGGWGFQPGGESAIEPTAWVLMAIGRQAGLTMAGKSVERGYEFLLAVQLPDGSWPAFPSQPEGCWVTSLACLALWPSGVGSDAALDGADWLCRETPGEHDWYWRLRNLLFAGRNIGAQDFSLYGWPWCHGTASWVEPTAMALLALERIPAPLLRPSSAERRRIGCAMLVNRMCPGGGWNSGNAGVYGVAGRPLVGPTVWALLALRHTDETLVIEKSLRWLEGEYSEMRSPFSGVLAHLCLQANGCDAASWNPESSLCHDPRYFLRSTVLLAWTAIVLRTQMPGRGEELFKGI